MPLGNIMGYREYMVGAHYCSSNFMLAYYGVGLFKVSVGMSYSIYFRVDYMIVHETAMKLFTRLL